MRQAVTVGGIGIGTVALLILPLTIYTPPDYVARTSASFNVPTGTVEDQYKLRREILARISQAPKDSTIRASLNVSQEPEVEQAFLDAHRRGVNVKIVVNDKTSNHFDELQAAIGTDKSKDSWIYRCPSGTGCVSNVGEGVQEPVDIASTNHNKFFLFSELEGDRNVVMNSSANFTPRNNWRFFNDTLTFKDNDPMYEQFKKFFNDQASGEVRGNDYSWSFKSKDLKLYTGPQASGDRLAEIIRSFGGKGTTIKIATPVFTRTSISEAVKDRAKAGAKVEIVFGKRTRAARDAAKHKNVDWYRVGDAKMTVHSKNLLVDGDYGDSKHVKVVWAGSENLDYASLRENDENMVRITDEEVYEQYDQNFTRMKSAVVE